MLKGAAFFKAMLDAPVPMLCIENPIMHCHAMEAAQCGKPTQIIQPWQHGHKKTKATCLWLRGLPPLEPSQIVGPPPKVMSPQERREWHEIHYMPKTADRGDKRSVTYVGVAVAMAAQWGLVYDAHQRAKLATSGSEGLQSNH